MTIPEIESLKLLLNIRKYNGWVYSSPIAIIKHAVAFLSVEYNYLWPLHSKPLKNSIVHKTP